MTETTPPESSRAGEAAAAKFRRTLIRVLIVQLVSMIVLGLVQMLYNR